MLIIEHLMDKTIVKIRKDWHPAMMCKGFTKKYDRHTSGGMAFQEIILQDKMRACQERVTRRMEGL